MPDLAPLAYRTVPVPTRDRPGPWPGVVLVHDAFGAGDDMHEQADWLAAAGYVVAMPDLYRGRRAVTCLKGTFAQLKAQRGPAFDHIEATRAQLAESGDCTGTVGVVGFCMGGAFALLVANRPGWSASSVTYGILPEALDGPWPAPARWWPASVAGTAPCPARRRGCGSPPSGPGWSRTSRSTPVPGTGS